MPPGDRRRDSLRSAAAVGRRRPARDPAQALARPGEPGRTLHAAVAGGEQRGVRDRPDPGRPAHQHRQLRSQHGDGRHADRARWTSSTPSSPRRPRLPPTLDQTDLTTLDSATLAQNGVISFAPTYPLWSDNAQKMRYVRVPRGQIDHVRQGDAEVLDPAQHPLLQDVPQAGDRRQREPDLQEDRDAPHRLAPRHHACPTERRSRTRSSGRTSGTRTRRRRRCSTDPLRDGKPFADRIFTYVTDEQKAQPIIASNPANLQARARRRRDHPPLRAPGIRALHPVPHGEPQRSLRPRLHAAAGRPPPDRQRAASTSPRPATS